MNILLDTKGGSYHILIERGCLEKAGETAVHLCKGRVAFVMTDDNVAPLYLERVTASLQEAGFETAVKIIPAGEPSKSLSMLEEAYLAMAAAKVTRGDILVALGGGVVGDLCGLAAATYLRGLPYLQIPTTLLAQTDSSVGGKCAVDMPFGKNTVGAFWQPGGVLIDPDTLKTLPVREVSCGMAEVIKYGCICDRALSERLEKKDISMEELIASCVSSKKRVVQQDERDTGGRMILNFGHTFGHAIENLGGYQQFKHGEGVSIGMVMAAKLGEAMGITEAGTSERIEALCKAYQLPTENPFSIHLFAACMAGDKKNIGKNLNLILLSGVGNAIIETVPAGDIPALLEKVFA